MLRTLAAVVLEPYATEAGLAGEVMVAAGVPNSLRRQVAPSPLSGT